MLHGVGVGYIPNQIGYIPPPTSHLLPGINKIAYLFIGTPLAIDSGIMKNKKNKAEQAYKEHMMEIEALVKSIRAGIKANHKEHTQIHWGHAGTLGHYAAQLRDIENSIQGTGEYAS